MLVWFTEMNCRGNLWDCTVFAGVLNQVRQSEPSCRCSPAQAGQVSAAERGKTLQCWRECQKTINTMAWHLVVISSFIRRRWFWAALMWHGDGSLCLLLFCISHAQYHSEVLQLQNQLVNCTAALLGADPPNNLFCCWMSDQKYSFSVFFISYVGSSCLSLFHWSSNFTGNLHCILFNLYQCRKFLN